jgi:hypothetical protein
MQMLGQLPTTHAGAPLLLPLPLPDPLLEEVAIAHAPAVHTLLALVQFWHT